MKSIFSDKASLVLRHLLATPEEEWVVRDFSDELKVARGGAAQVLAQLRKKGYLKGEARGRGASATLRHASDLVHEWTQNYDFEQNRCHAYYTPDANILPSIKKFFSKASLKEDYALTLHTGANLITNYVRDNNAYLYLNPDHFKELSLELRKNLDLKELKQGGNVYLIQPYYKKSAFFNMRQIKGYNVASNLQLYLDLYHFPERGKEHAEYLLRTLKEKGEALA